MKVSNIVFSIIMIGVSIYIYTYSMSLSEESSLFPTIISVPLFVFSCILLVMTLKDKYIITESVEVERRKKFKFIYAIIVMILYSIIINFLGFYISTVMLFIATVFILSEESFRRTLKSYITIFITSLTIVGVVYFLFNTLLGVPLPTLI